MTQQLHSLIVVHLRGYGMPFVAEDPCCCASVVICTKTPNPMCQYVLWPLTALWLGGCGPVLPAVPISRSVISISLDPSRSTWLANDSQQTPTWSKRLPPGTWHLIPIFSTPGHRIWCWGGKGLRVNNDYVEVWYVPSATHVTCVCRSQNKLVVEISSTKLFKKYIQNCGQ